MRIALLIVKLKKESNYLSSLSGWPFQSG